MSIPVMLMQPEGEEEQDEEDEEGKEADEEDDELLAQAEALVDQREELVQVRTAKHYVIAGLMADESDMKLLVRDS